MNSRTWNYYKVYNNRTGELVVFGTASECAKFIGVAESWFRRSVEVGRPVAQGRYRVELVQEDKSKANDESKLTREAIQNWDDFVKPIRKKFGIPVYKAKPEVRG